jgi:hypothetical protein
LTSDQRTWAAPCATRWSGGVGVVMSVLQPMQTTRRGPITGRVSYHWQPGDLSRPGHFYAEVRVVGADGSVATIPAAGYINIQVWEGCG